MKAGTDRSAYQTNPPDSANGLPDALAFHRFLFAKQAIRSRLHPLSCYSTLPKTRQAGGDPLVLFSVVQGNIRWLAIIDQEIKTDGVVGVGERRL